MNNNKQCNESFIANNTLIPSVIAPGKVPHSEGHGQRYYLLFYGDRRFTAALEIGQVYSQKLASQRVCGLVCR